MEIGRLEIGDYPLRRIMTAVRYIKPVRKRLRHGRRPADRVRLERPAHRRVVKAPIAQMHQPGGRVGEGGLGGQGRFQFRGEGAGQHAAEGERQL